MNWCRFLHMLLIFINFRVFLEQMYRGFERNAWSGKSLPYVAQNRFLYWQNSLNREINKERSEPLQKQKIFNVWIGMSTRTIAIPKIFHHEQIQLFENRYNFIHQIKKFCSWWNLLRSSDEKNQFLDKFNFGSNTLGKFFWRFSMLLGNFHCL